MEKSIEKIWKEDFMASELTKTPPMENLYNQKSKHLVEKLKRMFKKNLILIAAMAIAFWILYFFIDAVWQGTILAVLFLGLAWYSLKQMRKVHTLSSGLSSYEYLKSFEQSLKAAMASLTTVMRFFYPLTFLTAMSTIWFGGNNQAILTNRLTEKFPDMVFVGGVPLFILVISGVVTLLIGYFADKIYHWDVGLMYGRVFKKLKETISEMEELKKGTEEASS